MSEIVRDVKISVKFCILGAPGVGKTSLRRNYMGQNFLLSYATTLGVDFANKKITLPDNSLINLQIWDLAGQMNYINVTRSFLSHTNAALVVYDTTHLETFNHIKAWLKILHDSNLEKAHQIPFMVLKNKVDLQSEFEEKPLEVNADGYIRYLDKYNDITMNNIKAIPTSAKTGKNVELAFNFISQIVKDIIAGGN